MYFNESLFYLKYFMFLWFSLNTFDTIIVKYFMNSID